jgi:microcystin-dependent protein
MDPLIGTIVISSFDWAPVNFAFCQGQSVTISQYEALYSLIATLYGQQNTSSFNLPNLSGRAPVGSGQLSGGSKYLLAKQLGTETTALTLSNLPVHNHSAVFNPTPGTQKVTIPATTGNLSVTATPNLTASGNANLPVTASAKIGASAPSSKTNTLADKSLLTGPASGGVAIYGPPGSTADRQIGPDGAVTGTATGTVNVAVSGTVNVTVSGNAGTAATTADVNTITGGTVATGNAGGGAAFSNLQPLLVMNFIMAMNGIYPDRP